MYDNQPRSFASAFAFLLGTGVFVPWDLVNQNQLLPFNQESLNTIISSVKYLLERNQQVPPPTVSLFCRYGVREADVSVTLIESIESILHGLAREIDAYLSRAAANEILNRTYYFEDAEYVRRWTLRRLLSCMIPRNIRSRLGRSQHD